MPFSIVDTYHDLLRNDPDLTMPIAAIESLVLLLARTSTLSTVSETLDLLAHAVDRLKRSVANPISLSAGTDLFQRYLITALQQPRGLPRSTSSGGGGDFRTVRKHLVSNGRLFVARAKEARVAIGEVARRFVRDGSTVLTHGGSRVVGTVLRAAAEAQTRAGGAPRFRVVWAAGSGGEGAETRAQLRRLGVPVAVVPEAAVAYAMGQVDLVVVGAEGVVENGGVISRMGTYQMAVLAKAAAKRVYVVAESHKFVRMFPLGQHDLGVEQNIVDFTTGETEANTQGEARNNGVAAEKHRRSVSFASTAEWIEQTPAVQEKVEYFGAADASRVDSPTLKQSRRRSEGGARATKSVGAESTKEAEMPKLAGAVDYTPPEFITALITESGVHTPSAVSEELIKIWY